MSDRKPSIEDEYEAQLRGDYNHRRDKQDDQHLDKKVDLWAFGIAVVVIGAGVLFSMALWGWSIAQGGSP